MNNNDAEFSECGTTLFLFGKSFNVTVTALRRRLIHPFDRRFNVDHGDLGCDHAVPDSDGGTPLGRGPRGPRGAQLRMRKPVLCTSCPTDLLSHASTEDSEAQSICQKNILISENFILELFFSFVSPQYTQSFICPQI